jgi:predicted  nucleic acid-binding Zn-ribbon protein
LENVAKNIPKKLKKAEASKEALKVKQGLHEEALEGLEKAKTDGEEEFVIEQR